MTEKKVNIQKLQPGESVRVAGHLVEDWGSQRVLGVRLAKGVMRCDWLVMSRGLFRCVTWNRKSGPTFESCANVVIGALLHKNFFYQLQINIEINFKCLM